jgi:hypothetical protein
MTQYNGGATAYAGRTTPNKFFRSEDRQTKTVTVTSGQVLKAGTFLQYSGTGKVVAHTGLSEAAVADFVALTTGQTVILGGLTFTAGSAGATALQLAAAWSGIADGTGYVAAAAAILAAGIPVTVGTFSAGTLTGWNTGKQASATTGAVNGIPTVTLTNQVPFTSTSALTNATDLAATGTGTAPALSIVQGVTSFPIIAGVLLNDVNATGADVDATAYVEASFWASALVWYNDVNVDTVTNWDGSTTACTAYNTGTIGNTDAVTQRLQSYFVAGTEFEPLGFLNAGEVYL